MIGVLLPLTILGVAIIAGGFILWRSKSARSFTKRYFLNESIAIYVKRLNVEFVV